LLRWKIFSFKTDITKFNQIFYDSVPSPSSPSSSPRQQISIDQICHISINQICHMCTINQICHMCAGGTVQCISHCLCGLYLLMDHLVERKKKLCVFINSETMFLRFHYHVFKWNLKKHDTSRKMRACKRV